MAESKMNHFARHTKHIYLLISAWRPLDYGETLAICACKNIRVILRSYIWSPFALVFSLCKCYLTLLPLLSWLIKYKYNDSFVLMTYSLRLGWLYNRTRKDINKLTQGVPNFIFDENTFRGIRKKRWMIFYSKFSCKLWNERNKHYNKHVAFTEINN